MTGLSVWHFPTQQHRWLLEGKEKRARGSFIPAPWGASVKEHKMQNITEERTWWEVGKYRGRALKRLMNYSNHRTVLSPYTHTEIVHCKWVWEVVFAGPVLRESNHWWFLVASKAFEVALGVCMPFGCSQVTAFPRVKSALLVLAMAASGRTTLLFFCVPWCDLKAGNIQERGCSILKTYCLAVWQNLQLFLVLSNGKQRLYIRQYSIEEGKSSSGAMKVSQILWLIFSWESHNPLKARFSL